MAALESCLVLIPAVPAAEKTRIYHKVLNIIYSTDITGGQGPSGPNWRSPLGGVITDVYFSPTASEDAVCDPDALDANIVFHRPEDAKYFVEIAKTEFSGMKLMETQVFNAVVAHVHPEVVATLQSRGILEATSQQMKHIGGIVIHNEPRFAIKGLMPQVFACGNVLQAALKTSATMKTESRVPSTPEEGDNRGRINDPNASFTEQSRWANVETSCAGRLYPEADIRRAPPESQATRDSDMKTRAVDRAGTESSARTKPVVQDAQERVPARREASVKPPEDDATDKGGAFTTVYSRAWLHYDDKTNDDLKLSKQKFIESVGTDMGPAEVHGRTAQPLAEEGRNNGKGVHVADGGKPIGESYEEENEGDTRVTNSAASAQRDEEYTDNSHGRLSAPDDQRNEGKTVHVYDTKPDGSEGHSDISIREERGKPRHVDDTKPDRSEGDGNILTREERDKPLCMDDTKPDRSERDGNILPREERGKPRHVDDTKPDRSEGDGNIGTGEGRGKPLCMDDTKPDRSKRDGNTHTREERGKPLCMDDTKPDRSERDGNIHTRDERGKPLCMDDTKPDRSEGDGHIHTREERGKPLCMDDTKPDRSERDGNTHTREERGKPLCMDDTKPDRSERDGNTHTREERGKPRHVDNTKPDRSERDGNTHTREGRGKPLCMDDTKPDRSEGDGHLHTREGRGKPLCMDDTKPNRSERDGNTHTREERGKPLCMDDTKPDRSEGDGHIHTREERGKPRNVDDSKPARSEGDGNIHTREERGKPLYMDDTKPDRSERDGNTHTREERGKPLCMDDTKPDRSERDGNTHTREERGKPLCMDDTKPDRSERDGNTHTREGRGKPLCMDDTKPDRSERNGNTHTREERGKPLCMDDTKPDRSERDGNTHTREGRGKPLCMDDTKPDRSEGDGHIHTREERGKPRNVDGSKPDRKRDGNTHTRAERGKPLCMDDTKPNRSERDGNTHTREERGKPLCMDDTKPDRSEGDGNIHTREERGKPLYMDDTKPDRKRDGNILTREERGKALFMDDAKPDRSERDGNIHTREERGKPLYMDDTKPDRSERDGNIHTREERGKPHYMDDKKPDRSERDGYILTGEERGNSLHVDDRSKGDSNIVTRDEREEPRHGSDTKPDRTEGDESTGEEDQNAEENPHEQARSNREKRNHSVLGRDKRSPGPEYVHGDATSHAEGFVIADEATCGKETKKSTGDSSGAAILNFDDEHMSARLQRDRQNAELPVGTEETCSKSERATSDIELVKKRDDSDCMDQRVSEVNSGFVFGQANSSHEAEGPRDGEARGSGRGGTTLALDAALWSFMSVHDPGMKAKIDEVQAKCNVQLAEEMCASAGNLHITGENHKDVEAARRELTYLARECKTIELDVPMSKEEDLGEVQSKYPSVMLFWESSERVGVVGKVDLIDSQTHKISSDLRQEAEYVRRSQAGATTDSNLPSSSERRMVIGQDSSNLNPSAAMAQSVALEQQSDTSKGNSMYGHTATLSGDPALWHYMTRFSQSLSKGVKKVAVKHRIEINDGSDNGSPFISGMTQGDVDAGRRALEGLYGGMSSSVQVKELEMEWPAHEDLNQVQAEFSKILLWRRASGKMCIVGKSDAVETRHGDILDSLKAFKPRSEESVKPLGHGESKGSFHEDKFVAKANMSLSVFQSQPFTGNSDDDVIVDGATRSTTMKESSQRKKGNHEERNAEQDSSLDLSDRDDDRHGVPSSTSRRNPGRMSNHGESPCDEVTSPDADSHAAVTITTSLTREENADEDESGAQAMDKTRLPGDPALWMYITEFNKALRKRVEKIAGKHQIDIENDPEFASISAEVPEDVDAAGRALRDLYDSLASSVQVMELEVVWPAHEDLSQAQAKFPKILLWRRASGRVCIVGKSDAVDSACERILKQLKDDKRRHRLPERHHTEPILRDSAARGDGCHGSSQSQDHKGFPVDEYASNSARAVGGLHLEQERPSLANSHINTQHKMAYSMNAEQVGNLDLSDDDDDRHGVPSSTSRRNPGRMSSHGESPCDAATSADANLHAGVNINASLTREESADKDESGAQAMEKTRLPGDPALWMYITKFNKTLSKKVNKIGRKYQIDIEANPDFASISAEVPEGVDAAGRVLRDLYDSLASSVQVKELEMEWPAHEDLSQAQTKFSKIMLWRRASGRVCIVGKSDAVDSACERILKQLKDDKRRHRLPERHHTEPILRDSAARGDGCHGSSQSQDHKGFPVDEYASNSARAVGGLHLEQERPSLANSHINTQHKMAYSMNAEQVGNLDLSDDDDDRHGVPSSTSRRNPGRMSSHGESPCDAATSADANSHAGVNINASLTREESADKDESGAQAMEKTRLPGDPALWMYITKFNKTLSKQVNKIGRKYQIDIEANPDFASISAEVPEDVDAAGRVLRDLYDSLTSSVQVKELEMECPALETLIPVQAAFPKIMLWRRANGRVCIVGKNEAVDSECELILKELKDDKRRHRQPERHHTEPICRDSAARGDGFHGLSQSQDHKGFPVDEYDGDRARSPRQTGERTGSVQSNDEEMDALCARTDALSLSERVSSFEVDRYYWQYLTNRQQKQLGKIEDKYSVKLTTHHDGLSDVIHVTGQDDVMVGKAKSELERTYTSVAYSLTTKKTKLDKRNTISIAQLKQDKNKLLINEEADGIIAITGFSDAVTECCKQLNGDGQRRSEQATGRQKMTETGIATDGGPGATSGHVPRDVSSAFNAREMGSTKFPKTYDTSRLGDNNGSYGSEAAGRRHDNSAKTREENRTSRRSDNKDAFPNPEGGISDRQHGGQQPMPANVGAARGGNRRNRKLKVSPAESEVSAYRSTDAGAGSRGRWSDSGRDSAWSGGAGAGGRGRGFDSGRDSARSGGAGAGGHGGGGAPRCEPRGFRVATGRVILVHMADITKMSVEVIVNAANDRLEHIGGLALAIARGAGIRLEDESRQYIRQHGTMQTSQCIATTAGNLPCSQVLHAVGPIWNARPDNQSFNLLKATFSNILTLAYAMGIDSIAVPAVSSGIYGAPLEAVAAAIVQSVYTTELQYQNRPNPISLKEVHFVDISPRTVGIIQRAFDDVLRGRDSPWRSVDEAEVRRSIDARFAGGPFRSGQAAAGRRPDGEQPQERTQPQTTVNVDGWGDGASVPRSRQKQALRQGDPAADNKQEAECSICCSEITNRKVLEKCKHAFCAPCIDRWFAQKPTCPVCGQAYGAVTGNQPDGTMNWSSHYVNLPGYPGCGTIVIEYQFPSGIQTAAHPSPGKPYTGTSRTAYLPDNAQGRQVLLLLKMAFEAKLTFTIGTSVTTGANNTVTWNDIHHKTSNGNYGIEYGYPDPRYLDRVTEELAAKGIK